MGPDATQVSVVSYSGFARVNFQLNSFATREEVQEAVAAVEYFDIAGKYNWRSYTAFGIVPS